MIVYIIEQLSEYPLYKIGYTSKKLEYRINELSTGNPYDLKEKFTYKTKNACELESYLHRIFSHKKVKGEWFDLDEKDFMNVQSICEKYEKIRNEISIF